MQLIRRVLFIALGFLSALSAGAASSKPGPVTPVPPAKLSTINLKPSDGKFDPKRLTVVAKRGLTLGVGETANVEVSQGKPDLVLPFETPQAAAYFIVATVITQTKSAHLMPVSIDGSQPRARTAAQAGKDLGSQQSYLQRVELNAGKHTLRLWLPEGIILDFIELRPAVPPAVPTAAAEWQPTIVPPSTHPRLLIGEATLPLVKERLLVGSHAQHWSTVCREAEKAFTFAPKPNEIVGDDQRLLTAVEQKAFVKLMTGNRERGLEAVAIMRRYLELVEFGNEGDICRKIGHVIYKGSLVYDWCYDLLTPEDKIVFRKNLLRLAHDMEVSWPPFGQMVIGGHGNEAQISRDLLSMGVALWGDDDEPYRLCAYRILEEVVSVHDWEFRSGWHGQGSAYGQGRYTWDVWADWIFRRLSGKEVFSKDLGTVPYQFLSLQTPREVLLDDGDAWTKTLIPDGLFIWYSCFNDPVLKGEYERVQGAGNLPPSWTGITAVTYLLLDDPALVPETSLLNQPLAREFGEPHGHLIMRSGWTKGISSPDALVLMKGGGMQFFGHQHLDAGHFQIHYRGLLAADLGLYSNWGGAYHLNFYVRSSAHNVLLVEDPNEKAKVNGKISPDGGQVDAERFIDFRYPQKMEISGFRSAGKNLASAVGPNANRPLWAVLESDLTEAYANRVKSYVRSFVQLNLGIQGRPSALLVLDRIETLNAEFRKSWQLGSLAKPEVGEGTLSILSSERGPKGRLFVNTLLPEASDLEVKVVGEAELSKTMGGLFPAPASTPASMGWRTRLYIKTPREKDVYLNVLQAFDDGLAPLPVEQTLSEGCRQVRLANWIIGVSEDGGLIKDRFQVEVARGGGERRVLLTHLTPGSWTVIGPGGFPRWSAEVQPSKHELFFVAREGKWTVRPGQETGSVEMPLRDKLEAARLVDCEQGQLFVDGHSWPEVGVVREETGGWLEIEPFFKKLGARIETVADGLKVTCNGKTIAFKQDSFALGTGASVVSQPMASKRVEGKLYGPEATLATLAGYSLIVDKLSGSPLLERQAPWVSSMGICSIDSSLNNNTDQLWGMLNRGDAGQTAQPPWSTWAVGAKVTLRLLAPQTVSAVEIGWLNGNECTYRFELQTSADGKVWATAWQGQSAGNTHAPERYTFPGRSTSWIRLVGQGNSVDDRTAIVSLRLFE